MERLERERERERERESNLIMREERASPMKLLNWLKNQI